MITKIRSRLLSLSPKLQCIAIVGSTVILAFIIAYALSLFFDTHQLEANTDLSATVYQVLGTIYAILLSFTLWGVWQTFSLADASVQNEAYTLLDLVHMLESVATWEHIQIRDAALGYTQLVLEKEWPTLKDMTNEYINMREANSCESMRLVHLMQEITPNNERENIIFSQALALIANWLDARRRRLLIARGNSAKALWPLLIAGAFVLFSFHGLFVAKTIGIWCALLFGISLIIGITFYLIFILDCPFSGFFSIDVEPFKYAFNVLKTNKK